MNAMTETKPMFEAGKSYRTRNGNVAKIEEISNSGYFIIGGRIGEQWQCWTADGSWGNAQNQLDLLPGAIEDEKSEAFEPFWQRMEGELRAQALTIAGMAAKIEALTNQEGHQARINLEAIHRDDEQAQQIGTLQEAQIKTFARLDYHNIRLPTPDELPTKRTIKGGWVNVYSNNANGVAGYLHANRRDADEGACRNRIACIQIPDIQEGEGL